jgi:pilus assembly protein Flp/PilA
MKSLFNRFIKDESGATAIEYGLIAALVAVAIIAALNAMTGELNGVFGKVSGELTKAKNTNTGS